MSQPAKVDPGRVDHLARGVFEKLLNTYANPEIRFTCRMLSDEIEQCFEENLGPGTRAHAVGKRIMKAIEGR